MDDENNSLSGFAERLSQSAEYEQPTEDSQSGEDEGINESEDSEDAANEQESGKPAEEGAEAQEDQPETESAAPQKVKLTTGDGEELELPLDEVKAGYLRQRDYTQKTQQLAQARQVQEQEMAQARQQTIEQVQQFQQQYGQLYSLQHEIARYEQALAKADYNADPDAYNQAQIRLLTMRGQSQELAAQLQAVQQQTQQSQMQALRQRQTEVVESLKREIPNFGPELVKEWESVGKKYGFTEQEMSMFDDPRQFKVLQDLTELARLRANKPAVVKKAAAAPSKQAATVAPPKLEQAKQRYRKSGKLEDFAQALALSRS